MSSKNNLKKGDWVLFKPKQGNIFKLCEVILFGKHWIILKNLDAKSSSRINANKKLDFIIPVPKDNKKIKEMNIKSLLVLYAKKEDIDKMDINKLKYFEPSTHSSVQLNFNSKQEKNKFMEELKKIKNTKVKKKKSSNESIDEKYSIEFKE